MSENVLEEKRIIQLQVFSKEMKAMLLCPHNTNETQTYHEK